MFCRFCGRNISEDSIFCRYCGKNVEEEIINDYSGPDISIRRANEKQDSFRDHSVIVPRRRKKHRRKKHDFAWETSISEKSIKLLNLIVIGVLVAFHVLLIKMAPGFGSTKFFNYLLISAIVSFVFWLLIKKIKNTHSAVFSIVTIGLLGVLLISSILFRVVYSKKVDVANKDVPETGFVNIRVAQIDTKYYSTIESKQIVNPSTFVKIGSHSVESGTVFSEEINQNLALHIGGGYQRDYIGLGDTGEHSYDDFQISFFKRDFINGVYQIEKRVDLSESEFMIVRIKLVHVRGFWDVVFYKTKN